MTCMLQCFSIKTNMYNGVKIAAKLTIFLYNVSASTCRHQVDVARSAKVGEKAVTSSPAPVAGASERSAPTPQPAPPSPGTDGIAAE